MEVLRPFALFAETFALGCFPRSIWKRFLHDRRGNVAVVSALTMPVLVAFVGMVAEYGHGLMLKSEDQRVADLAAYSAALAYSSTADTASIQPAADSAAALNGVGSAQVAASLVSSPNGSGNPAVLVTVTTVQPLYLTRLVSAKESLKVFASAYAEIKGGAACILALKQSGAGVALSGGTAVQAPGCAVASNASVGVPCGDTITTIDVTYDTAAPSQPCKGIVPPSGGSLSITKAFTSDPFANNSSVQAATAFLSTVASLSSPATPSISGGTAIDFGWSQSATEAEATADGCTASFSSSASTWTLTCPSGGSTYTFGAITLEGGLKLVFNTSGSASTTYNFSGVIQNNGASMTFGSGTFNMAKGVDSGSGTVTFGAGTFNIGRMTATCGDGAYYSICNPGGATITFGGPSAFNISAGVYNSGGAKMTLGSGSTNSFDIGSSSNGNAISTAGGSTTVLADATGSSDIFDVVGNIVTGGGSCMTFSAAADHEIDGSLNTSGGVILGSGVYSVTGYVALGAAGGGDVTCNGSDVGMNGDSVSFVIGASTTLSSGTCAGQAFCLAAGYRNVTLTASGGGFLVIGPTSPSNTAGATFTEGASNTSLSGIFYLPNGAISLSGGASVGNGASQCLELIGSQVTLTGGTTLATTCSGVNQAAVATVELVQ